MICEVEVDEVDGGGGSDDDDCGASDCDDDDNLRKTSRLLFLNAQTLY